jgi:hypothetical protein
MAFAALAFAIALGQTVPSSTAAINLSQPATVAQLDGGKLKGEPVQLAWSDDGTMLFLQVAERDRQGMLTKPRFYIVSTSNGMLKSIDAPPDWAADYWRWKSNKSAPASGKFAIDIKEDFRQVSATANPMGGAYAKGGTPDGSAGTTVSEATNAVLQSQKEHVFSLTLKGETVGEFVNAQFLPGYTFGWSAPPTVLIAYANSSGHLALMDEQGIKKEVAVSRNVILPAWSTNNKRIAYIQKTGKNKYDLFVVEVTGR